MHAPKKPLGYKEQWLEVFRENFDLATYQRGVAYAQEGRALVEHVEQFDDITVISGLCRGQKKKPYSLWVEIDMGFDRPILMDNDCSCPMSPDCKHVAALLLEFLSTLDDEAILDDTTVTAQDKEASPTTVQTSLSPEALEWLALLDSPPSAEAEPLPNMPFLVYLLNPDQQPKLSLGKSKPLKRGNGVAKPSNFVPYPTDLHANTRRDFIADDDMLPLQLFLSLQTTTLVYSFMYRSEQREVALSGEGGRLMLERAAVTGRLYLKGDMSAPLKWANRPLALAWVYDNSGRQALSYDMPSHVSTLATWPPTYFDPKTREVGELESPWPLDMLEKLLKAPPLSEYEASIARSHLTSLSKRKALPVCAPLPDAIEPESPSQPPTPRLTLTLGRFMHQAASSLANEYPIARLHFDYGRGVWVPGGEAPPPLLRIECDGAVSTIRRDLDTELQVWARLRAAGLESRFRRLPHYRWVESAEDCLLASPADSRGWLPLLDGGIAALKAEGMQVIIADDFPFELLSTDDWFVALEEASGNDWFDLDLGVMIDGERISLVSPLIKLLSSQANLLGRLAGMPEEERIPVPLDERRFVPVPAARLKAWLRPLLEFLDEDRPRLSRYHAAALAELDEQPSQWLSGDALRALGNKLKHFQGIDETPPAPNFKADLRPYQRFGLSWLQFLREYGFSGILADDMGLGKTVQTLAHIQLEKHAGRADRPSLVIAPTSLLPNWAAEARQFAPDLKLMTLHGPDRAQHFEHLSEADLILTTYPLLVRDRETLVKQDYHLLVLDEAQFIKNPKAQSHAAARRLKARHRLSLTGTPLENHLGELWAQFDFLMPGLLGNATRFFEAFRGPIERRGDTEARERLGRRVAPFMLRRTKEQVLTELPPCTEIVRWVEFGNAQRDLYESLRVVFDKKLRGALEAQGVGRSQIVILDALLKLRQVCCDPRLVRLGSAQEVGKKGLANSAKLNELLTLVEELLDEGRRILLFSQFTSMLGLIETEFEKRKWAYAKLTGQTRDREKPVQDFQQGRVPIMMISLKAGGTGLNLTAADTVIHYDPWWNPAVEAQATARAHRIGQDKPVFVYKLLGTGTVEEKILALQARKQGLSDQLLSGRGDKAGSHLITADDLDVLFQPLSAK